MLLINPFRRLASQLHKYSIVYPSPLEKAYFDTTNWYMT